MLTMCVFMGSVVLSMCKCSLVLYFAGYGVNSVQVILSRLSIMLLSFVHVYNFCRYGCMYAFLLVCRCHDNAICI